MDEQIESANSYLNRAIKKPYGMVILTLVQISDALGYDIELHYVKRVE